MKLAGINFIAHCSEYGALLEDLIQVLLSVEVEGRPSAEQVQYNWYLLFYS